MIILTDEEFEGHICQGHTTVGGWKVLVIKSNRAKSAQIEALREALTAAEKKLADMQRVVEAIIEMFDICPEVDSCLDDKDEVAVFAKLRTAIAETGKS